MVRDQSHTEFQPPPASIVTLTNTFVAGLANLESGVGELRRAYISHFNSLLPENHPARITNPFALTNFNPTNPLPPASVEPPTAAVVAAGNGTGAGAPAPVASGEKRKRKAHDPMAPKRALTSYFIFMRHNKPEIKGRNPGWTAQQVSEESERRWNHISEEEKAEYEYMYQVDLCRYYKQKEAYEAGQPIPTISEEEAVELWNQRESNGLSLKGRKGPKNAELIAAPVPTAEDKSSSDDSDTSEDDDESSEEEVASAPPPKAKKVKTAKGSSATTSTVPMVPPTPQMHAPPRMAETPVATQVSEKKKRSSKKSRAQEPVAEPPAEREPEPKSPAPSSPIRSSKKDKRKNKKRHSEAARS